MILSRLFTRRVGLSLLGLALAGAFGLVVARSGPLAPIRVTVATVAPGAIAPALFGIGTVEARKSYLIGPTAAGRVARVLVDVGDAVKAGQLLAEMEPVDLDPRIAALDAAIARADNAVAAARAQGQDAQARKDLAALNAARYVDLGARHFVSPSAVEAREQERISAQAVMHAAQANLAGAGQDIARLKAERDGLRRQRDNLRLVAPADGIVTARDAENGSTLVAGQSLVKLVDPASLWVRVRLDQARSGGLAVGLPATIVLRSAPAAPLPGKVVRVELLSDSVTEERVAQVAFDRLPVGLSLGELAEVTLQLPATAAAFLLPNAAIKRRGGQAGVWLARDGALRFAPLQLGVASLDGQVQVLGGLQAGDQVVVHSEKEIAPDSRFKIVASLAGRGT